jgi:copper chaperone CopZ
MGQQTMTKKQIVGVLILAVIMTFSTAAVSAASTTVTIRIEGMHCKNCAASIQKKLKAADGVEGARVSFPKKEAWVKFDDKKISVAKLREVINSTGFKAME